MAQNFLNDLRAFVMKGGGGAQGTGMAGAGGGAGAPTGPGVTPSGVRMPAPRSFVAPPGAPPAAPVGRPAISGANGYASLPEVSAPTVAGIPGGGAAPMATGAPPAGSQPSLPMPTVAGEQTTGTEGAPALFDPTSAIGTPDPVTGEIILSPEGKQRYQERMAQARAAFGPYPGANDPSTPPPPLTPGKMFFNPFTGTYGRA